MKKLITIFFFLLTLNSYGQTALDVVVFEKINEYRVENGVTELALDTSIYKAAYLHSKYLHDNGYPFNYPLSSGHYEKVLEKPSNRLREQGVLFLACGENIACFTSNLVSKDGWVDMEAVANYVLDMWINSPGHHRLMISPKPISGAIGVYIDSGKIFVVLNVVK
jgi:uncharacterized protein YkwD